MSIKITTDEFIAKAVLIHGSKYKYSNTIYKTSNQKIEVLCEKHGPFFILPSNHIKGSGCKQCAIDARRINPADFVIKSKKIHGDKYDYTKTNFTHADEKVLITCKVHGDFEIRAANHILKNKKAQGCKKCGLLSSSIKQKTKRSETIFNDFKSVHGERYDYSESVYYGLHKKMKIICKTHGPFLMTPASHFHQKSNCPDCVTDSLKNNGAHNRINTEEFIKRAKAVHGNVYDYSLTEFTGMHSPVKIICREHGVFEQSKAQNHLENEFNCPVCLKSRYDEYQKSQRITYEEAKQKVYEVHRDTIKIEDYSNYAGIESKITFKCNRIERHGTWEASLHSVTSNSVSSPGTGCPICKMSKGEKSILFKLQDEKIKFKTQKYFKELGKKRFDFYLPFLNLVIEYNGRQHYEKIDIWGGQKGLENIQKSDRVKKEFCQNNDINYEVIRYDEDVQSRMNEILQKYS